MWYVSHAPSISSRVPTDSVLGIEIQNQMEDLGGEVSGNCLFTHHPSKNSLLFYEQGEANLINLEVISTPYPHETSIVYTEA